MITRAERVGLVLGSLLMTIACSMAPTPATNPDTVRQHADKTFQQLLGKDPAQRYDVIMNEANLVEDLDI